MLTIQLINSHINDIIFFKFQDKIRLLQDDLESERELRQRVSLQIIYSVNVDKGPLA